MPSRSSSRSLHTKVSAIQRSQAQSSVASAAYICGMKITDERTGTTHDYRRKQGVVRVEVFGYEGSVGQLVNAAEKADNRKNSITGRQFLTEIPHELSPERQYEYCVGLASFLREELGVAGFFGIHAPPEGGDERNRHVHPWITSRRVDQAGHFLEKTRTLDVKASSSVFVRKYRKHAADLANKLLIQEGFASSATYDPRKFKEQGITRLKTQKEGKAVTAMRRRGKLTARAQANDSIRHANSTIAALDAVRVQLESEWSDAAIGVGSFTETTRGAFAARVRERERAAAVAEQAAHRRKRDLDQQEQDLRLHHKRVSDRRSRLDEIDREAKQRDQEAARRERAAAAIALKPSRPMNLHAQPIANDDLEAFLLKIFEAAPKPAPDNYQNTQAHTLFILDGEWATTVADVDEGTNGMRLLVLRDASSAEAAAAMARKYFQPNRIDGHMLKPGQFLPVNDLKGKAEAQLAIKQRLPNQR